MYPRVEWKQPENSLEPEDGYIVDVETGLEVMPWELIDRYNDLVTKYGELHFQYKRLERA